MKDQLESLVRQMVDRNIDFRDALFEFEKRFIGCVLEKTEGNQSEAAKVLGIHRNTLSRKLEALNNNHHPSPPPKKNRR